MSKSIDKKLINYANLGYNVMIEGYHGIGKTEIITKTFNHVFGEKNKDWLYFSASTLDPWVDFIGIPKNYTNANGEEVFKIIPPEQFANSDIKAIYFDEYNRSDDKTRNAIMELIQFKSINGRKFKNLKVIWASINPQDDDLEYQVEEVDPAQIDRFQIFIKLKYDVNVNYFKEKYGEQIGLEVCKWWRLLEYENKKKVSPRRLDYAIDAYKNNCDINDVLPQSINTKSLISSIRSTENYVYLKKIFEENKPDVLSNYLTINKINDLLPVLNSNPELFEFCLPYIPKDFLFSLLDSNYLSIKKEIIKNKELNKHIINFLNSSFFLSFSFIDQLKEKRPLYNETQSYIISIKNFHNNTLSKQYFYDFLSIFNNKECTDNNLVFNFLFICLKMDVNILKNIDKTFQTINNENNFISLIKNLPKNQQNNFNNCFIFLFKISYFYSFLKSKNKISNMDSILKTFYLFYNNIPLSISSNIKNFNIIENIQLKNDNLLDINKVINFH